MCLGVPLRNNKVPKIGMKIENLYAFSYNDTINLKISNSNKCYIKKSPEKYFKYKLCGIVVDSINAIIQVFDFIINLQNYYPNGFDSTIKNSDYVEFDVDRIDCTLI